MRALEARIPPVIVILASGLLAWLLSLVSPRFAFDLPYRRTISGFVIALGVAVITIGVETFSRAKTSLNPTKPESASSLVRSGIYRVTRNPMYVGLTIVLTGWCGLQANGVSFLVVPAFVAYLDKFQIRPEERALEQNFGEEYDAYRREVRRWI